MSVLEAPPAKPGDPDADEPRAATESEIVVYRLYGHYSFNSRDGGERVKLMLADGYSVGEWLNGGKMIVGRRLAMSVEQAIFHGLASIIR